MTPIFFRGVGQPATSIDWIHVLGTPGFASVRRVSCQEKLLAELTPELEERVQYAEVSCVEEKHGKYRFLAHCFLDHGNFRILKWRYVSTIYGFLDRNFRILKHEGTN